MLQGVLWSFAEQMWCSHFANQASHHVAAKAALRRKKAHERSLEQTRAQVMQIEQQIYSIEAANINQETLNAMKNAGSAMKLIHSGLTIEKVDATMYVWDISLLSIVKDADRPRLSTGTNSVNSTPWARRSLLPSPEQI